MSRGPAILETEVDILAALIFALRMMSAQLEGPEGGAHDDNNAAYHAHRCISDAKIFFNELSEAKVADANRG